LAEEEDFLALMGATADTQQQDPAELAPAGVDEARRRQEFWYAFVRSAVLPYAAYLPYSLIFFAAIATPLVCVTIFGAAADVRLLRGRLALLSRSIAQVNGLAEAGPLCARFTKRLCQTAGKYVELPIWIGALLAMELLVGQASLFAAGALILAAVLLFILLLSVLAATAAVHAAARRRTLCGLAENSETPQLPGSGNPLRCLTELRKQQPLALAASVAAAAWVAAAARMML
jgi:hypothetical protein